MPGWDNGVSFGNAFRILPSDAEDIQLSQRLPTDVALLNVSVSPEGAINANPGSVAYDQNGYLWLKESGTGNTGWAQIVSATVFTALPAHSIVLGTGTDTLSSLATTAVSGQIVQSGGALADPFYSTATYPSSNTGDGKILRGSSGDFLESTATYPDTTTINRILYSSADNTISEITTANNSILSTDGSGVPNFGTSLANDYSFTQSTAGSSRVVTASHSDNTNTSSNAYFNASVGGTSGGDAWHQVTVGTARSYVFGVDNTDSQALKINTTNAATLTPSTGTNLWKMTSAGERTMPLQPAFQVYPTSNVTNVTGDGTVYTCVWGTEVFDQGGDFASNTFTAPVTGRYQLNVVVGAANIGASHTTGQVRLITSNRSYRLARGNYANLRDAVGDGANAYWGGTVLADMDAGDTATVTLTVLNSTLTVTFTGGSGESTFSGFLAV